MILFPRDGIYFAILYKSIIVFPKILILIAGEENSKQSKPLFSNNSFNDFLLKWRMCSYRCGLSF